MRAEVVEGRVRLPSGGGRTGLHQVALLGVV